MSSTKRRARHRRHRRVRQKVQGTAQHPRLSVFRSSRHIYAQLIDDVEGRTLVAVSTMELELRSQSTATVEAANAVGKLLGERAVAAGLRAVVFDRGGFKFHGRVAAVAAGARKAGLEF